MSNIILRECSRAYLVTGQSTRIRIREGKLGALNYSAFFKDEYSRSVGAGKKFGQQSAKNKILRNVIQAYQAKMENAPKLKC